MIQLNHLRKIYLNFYNFLIKGMNRDVLNRLLLLRSNKNYEEAIKLLEGEDMNNPFVLNAIGVIYAEMKNKKYAGICFKKVLEFSNCPNGTLIDTLDNLGTLETDNCLAVKYFNKAERLSILYNIPKKFTSLQNKLLRLNRIYTTNEYIYNEHIKVSNFFKRVKNSNNLQNINFNNIGYVSSDFMGHAVTKFITEILVYQKEIQKKNIICYYNNITNVDIRVIDRTEEYFKSYNIPLKKVGKMSDDSLESLIKQDSIAILFDLNGHTEGNRLGVFARKPAPIQISYLGYPNTTGLPEMDIRFGDLESDKNLENNQKYTETLIKLPFFLLYRPNDIGFFIDFAEDGKFQIPNYPIRRDRRDSRDSRDTSSDKLIFGTLNNFTKFSNEYVDTLIEILEKTSNSILLIKLSEEKSFYLDLIKSRKNGDKILNRIIFENQNLENTEYYEIFNKIDILLDTFPYTGTTTTCDSLYMGIPVLTLSGMTHAHNVSSSILKNAGQLKYIFNKRSEYINFLVTFKKLNYDERISIRKSFISSMNTEKFMKNYDNAIENIKNIKNIKK